MTLIAFAVVFLLPLVAFVALARVFDEELREAISFNIALFCLGASVLVVLELAT